MPSPDGRRPLPSSSRRSRAVGHPAAPRTWLVECYGPGIDEASVARSSDRARAAVEILRAEGSSIEYLGALLVVADEAVFHAFAATDETAVAEVSRRATLRHERIVESVAVQAPTLVDALTALLARSQGQPPGNAG